MDGTIYTSKAQFQWPAGSKHLVSFIQDRLPPGAATDPTVPIFSYVQLTPDGDILYGFLRWVDSTGLLIPASDPDQVVTADPSITFLVAKLSVEYRVLLDFFDARPSPTPVCSGAPGDSPSGLRVGLVYIGSQCYWNSDVLYFPAGSALTLNAFPYPGFVFLGWSTNLGPPDAYLRTYVLNGPLTLAPRFVPGKRVRFYSDPAGLNVLVDRTSAATLSVSDASALCPQSQNLPFGAPAWVMRLCLGDFDFAPGSPHLIGGVSPQTDRVGKVWVYDSWSSTTGQSGQLQNSIYTTDVQTSNSDRVTVVFRPGAGASFVTNPPGLKLTIDGRDNWPAYNFTWALGSTHQVTAAAQQTDRNGRVYTFTGWSNGGTATQSFTLDNTAVTSGFRITANYSVLSRVVVQTSPAGLKLSVDGADCVAPCIVDKASGSQVRVTAPTSISIGDGARLDLASWSDGGAADHVYTISSDSQTLTVSYNTLYRLSTSSNPAHGATFHLDPASSDGYYPADTQVTVAAAAGDGFKFRRWGGDLTGTYPTGTLQISGGPHTVVALLDRVPFIAPAGVRNAAAITPDAVVAPGSLIVITGESLAPDTVVGRVNPLPQTIENVTVTIGDRYLPMISVTPEQVAVQLPSDLADGDYTLQVHSQGQPDVSGTFTVARDAPGLFTTSINSKIYAVATHADGTRVTPDSPAAQGETITFYGTGFGPYSAPVIDGFFPFDPAPTTVDSVNILVGGQVFQPDWTGAALNYTGLVAVRLTIPGTLPTATEVELQVRMNTRLSNTVLLPLQ